MQNYTTREDFDLDGESYGKDTSSVLDAMIHFSTNGQGDGSCTNWTCGKTILILTIPVSDEDTAFVEYCLYGTDAETFLQNFPGMRPAF